MGGILGFRLIETPACVALIFLLGAMHMAQYQKSDSMVITYAMISNSIGKM